jgi:UDP-3-O-[3-hydroxymyristoyl] glucosamine N-acyltransferase LpxD
VRGIPLASIWPQAEALAEALRKQGFKAELPEDSPLRQLQAWQAIARARGLGQETAGPSDFAYLSKVPSEEKDLRGWGLLLVDPALRPPLAHLSVPVLWTSHADAAMDFVLRKVSASEWTGESASVPAGVRVETGVVIGPECSIGEGTVLEAGVRLGARVSIGRNCRIGAHSRIGDDTEIGNECQLTGSVSLGGQGFGLVRYPGERSPRPRLHVGRVVLGARVRLGAFVAVDRAVFGETRIGSGSSVDNIVQIAHNCELGEDNVLCSFVGLSGSTQLGDRVTFAGLAGTKGHLRVGHDVTVAAQSGVSKDIPDGLAVKGYPARPLPLALRISALVDRLPELYERLRSIEKEQKT